VIKRVLLSVCFAGWILAMLAAAWTFADGQTWPLVGANMFAVEQPTTGGVYREPNVVGFDARGKPIVLGPRFFGVEPFELQQVLAREVLYGGPESQARLARQFAKNYEARTGTPLERLEFWLLPPGRADLSAGERVAGFSL
jgi:hypothetical protein